MTDLGRIVPLLEEGVEWNQNLLNESGKFLRVRKLEWGNKEDIERVVDPDPDLIVVSDCVYYEASLAPLIWTLRELARRSGDCPVIVCYEERDYSEDKKRVKENFLQLADRYFIRKSYKTSECHPEYSSDDIKVIRLDLKP